MNQVEGSSYYPPPPPESSSAAVGAMHLSNRLYELEAENRRLSVLVVELLIKNQQLRKGNCSEV